MCFLLFFFFFPLCYLFLDHSLYFVSSTFFPSLLQSDTLVNRDGMALSSSLRCCLLAAFFSPCCRTAACPSWPVSPVQCRAWWKYLLLASASCTLSKAWGTSAPVSTVWMHLPFGQLSSPGLGTSSWVLARELVAWTPLSICWVQRWAGFPPLLGPPHPRASCYGHCPLSHATQSCHLLALPVIALVFLPLNKSLFSRQRPPPDMRPSRQERQWREGWWSRDRWLTEQCSSYLCRISWPQILGFEGVCGGRRLS